MPGFQSQTSPGFAGRSLKSLPAQRPLLACAHMPQSAEPKGRPMPASLTQQVSCSCHLPRIMSCSRGIVHSHLADRILEKRGPVGVPCRLNVGTCISFHDAWSVSVQVFHAQDRQGAYPVNNMQCAIAMYPLASTHAGVYVCNGTGFSTH